MIFPCLNVIYIACLSLFTQYWEHLFFEFHSFIFRKLCTNRDVLFTLCLLITPWTLSLSFLKKNCFVLHQTTDHLDSNHRKVPCNQCAVFWAWESLKIKIKKRGTKKTFYELKMSKIYTFPSFIKKRTYNMHPIWLFNVHWF